MNRTRTARRRGSAYIMAIGLGTMLTVIALGAITAGRSNLNAMRQAVDWQDAQLAAGSAVEHALDRIRAADEWRGLLDAPQTGTVGRASYTWTLTETDGNILLTAAGTVGDARHTLGVTMSAGGEPLPVLGTCVAASGDVEVRFFREIRLTDGMLVVNETLRNSGMVRGDVEAESVSGWGVIDGEVTISSDPAAMPSASVFLWYKAQATPIPGLRSIDKELLSPAANPWGAPNADGVYYIDTGGQNLYIRQSRIVGTLVVKCRPGRVVISDSVLLEHAREDYPVLIVDGDVELTYDSGGAPLRESSAHTNFNPPGSEYEGSADSDTSDTYPNEIHGLVHVIGDFAVKTGFFSGDKTIIRGTVLCDGDVSIEGKAEIIFDPDILSHPPMGYREEGKPTPTAWRRVVN